MAKKIKEPKMDFKDKDEALVAQQQFKEIKNHPAWTRIAKYYKKKIELLNNELLDGEIKSLDQLERIRDKIRLCEQFINLPEILSTMIDMSKGKAIDFDPYYRPDQIEIKKN